jgi:hypothetical protein
VYWVWVYTWLSKFLPLFHIAAAKWPTVLYAAEKELGSLLEFSGHLLTRSTSDKAVLSLKGADADFFHTQT